MALGLVGYTWHRLRQVPVVTVHSDEKDMRGFDLLRPNRTYHKHGDAWFTGRSIILMDPLGNKFRRAECTNNTYVDFYNADQAPMVVGIDRAHHMPGPTMHPKTN